MSDAIIRAHCQMIILRFLDMKASHELYLIAGFIERGVLRHFSTF